MEGSWEIISAVGAIVGALGAIAAVIVAVRALSKAVDTANAQQHLEKYTIVVEWNRDFRTWASEAIEVWLKLPIHAHIRINQAMIVSND